MKFVKMSKRRIAKGRTAKGRTAKRGWPAVKSKKEIIHNHLETGKKTVSWEELSEEQKKNQARQIFAALAHSLGYREKEQRID